MKVSYKVYSEDHSTASERALTPTMATSSANIHPRLSGSQQKVPLFVGGLAFNITEADLQSYFEQFGKVAKLVLLRDRATGISKGYAFITIEGRDAAEAVLAQKNYICGRRVEVQTASKKNEKHLVDEQRKRKRIFVSHVPATVTNAEFEAFFSQFGEIHNCYIIQNYDGQTNKPYGFVEYVTEEQAMAVLHRKKELVLRGSRLSLQQFKSKEDEPVPQKCAGPTQLVKHKHQKIASGESAYPRSCQQDLYAGMSLRSAQQPKNLSRGIHHSETGAEFTGTKTWRPLREMRISNLSKNISFGASSNTQQLVSSQQHEHNLRFNVMEYTQLKHLQPTTL